MTRVDIHKDARDLYRAYLALDRATGASALDKPLAELVKLRASMVNGCAYCVDMHSQRRARSWATTRSRLSRSPPGASRRSFSERERAAFAFTDAVTKLEAIDDAYALAAEHFETEELTALLYTIVTVNGWNRLAIATHMVTRDGRVPQRDDVDHHRRREPGEGPDTAPAPLRGGVRDHRRRVHVHARRRDRRRARRATS